MSVGPLAALKTSCPVQDRGLDFALVRGHTSGARPRLPQCPLIQPEQSRRCPAVAPPCRTAGKAGRKQRNSQRNHARFIAGLHAPSPHSANRYGSQTANANAARTQLSRMDFAAASSLNRRGLASNVMGGLRLDQSNLGRSDCSLRVSLRRAAGQSRLVMRRRSTRLGDIFGRRAGLCGRLGPAGATQLLLEAGHVRPLEADLSALIIAYRE